MRDLFHYAGTLKGVGSTVEHDQNYREYLRVSLHTHNHFYGAIAEHGIITSNQRPACSSSFLDVCPDSRAPWLFLSLRVHRCPPVLYKIQILQSVEEGMCC